MKIHAKAVNKQAIRRAKARERNGDDWLTNGTCLSDLVAVGTHFHVADKKNNNTTALGYCSGDFGNGKLYFSCKGYARPDPDMISRQANAIGLAHSGVEIIGDISGLHSEMAIVRTATGGSKDLLKSEFFCLEIACIGKGVCPDCSGYLVKHSIPHTAARANAAAQWVNPMTGGYYSGTGAMNLSYRKGGGTFTPGMPGGEYEKGWANG